MTLSKTNIFSWLIVAWITKVFLFSLPYKFTLHPDTQHIFASIGQWMKGWLGIEVLHQGQSDHGSLFYAATSIVFLGLFLIIINIGEYQGRLLTEKG